MGSLCTVYGGVHGEVGDQEQVGAGRRKEND